MRTGKETRVGVQSSARAEAGDSDRAADRASAQSDSLVWSLVEETARTAYGRLVALLAATSGDIQLAEDALSDAFEQALRRWPESGAPQNPEGWLLTVARNRQRDVFKSAAARTKVPLNESLTALPAELDEFGLDAIPDRRLALLFVCAHPAIDARIRTPLMLQTVLGCEVQTIARVYALPPATLAQRLVRAKRRIRDARIPFVAPDLDQLPVRLNAVLEAVYGAYVIDWQVVAGAFTREGLASEAWYLARTLADLLPDEPEALGLAALLSLSLARAGARGSADEFVPLEEQDTSLWNTGLIDQGEQYLRRAFTFGRIGRFQLEAAIQSAHCARAATGTTDWPALCKLYTALVAIAPTLGAQTARAAAVARVEGPEAGLTALGRITGSAIQRFQPYWATRAHLLAAAERAGEAGSAYDRAIALTVESGVRRYLNRRRAALKSL